MKKAFICLDDLTGLAYKVSHTFGEHLYKAHIDRFADGEMAVRLPDPILFKDAVCVIIQSTGAPIYENTLNLSFLAHELHNAGAQKIIAAIPYLGFSRQEKSALEGKPGQVHVIARLLEAAYINEIISVELHEPAINEFFSIPFINISTNELIANLIKEQFDKSGVCIVSPDEGAADMIKTIAQLAGCKYLIFEKQRVGVDKTAILGYKGACDTDSAIIVDDIIATGGTSCNVATYLKHEGYEKVSGFFVHPVLSANVCERLKESGFSSISVSNTLSSQEKCPQISLHVFDVSPLIVAALKRIFKEA